MAVTNDANPRILRVVNDHIVPSGGLQITAIRVANAGNAGAVELYDRVENDPERQLIYKHFQLAANTTDDIHFDAIYFRGVCVGTMPAGALVFVYCK